MSLKLFLQWLSKILREKFLTWNLFNSRSTDQLIIRHEILRTRLYIVLVIISLIILTTYSSISARIEKKTVPSPNQSMYKNLQKKYSDSLQCSCSKISIPYGQFVETVPSFHQVCSSEFISQLWIDFVFRVNLIYTLPIDVRTSLSAMWQLMKGFCESAMDTTTDTLDDFHNSLMVSSILLTKESLEVKVQAALDFLRYMASSNFRQSITIVHELSQANQLMSGLLTNYIGQIDQSGHTYGGGTFDLISIDSNLYKLKHSTGICSCKSNRSCPIPGNIYSKKIFEKFDIYDLNVLEPEKTLSGIIIDCIPLQMTFSSSLECFYNQSCLNILFSSYENQLNISILDQSIPSRFNSTTKIEYLINELFIEEIFKEINYTKYYYQCLPDICNYIYVHRFNWIYTLTNLFSLFGGITAVLHSITPLLLRLGLVLKKKLFCKRSEQIIQNQEKRIQVRLKELLLKIKNKIINFNAYTKYSRQAVRVYEGVLATRLYILLLFITICIIITFSQLSNQIINERIIHPSEDEYRNLEEKSLLKLSSTLSCPCTQISVPYEDFIELDVKYHQICSSDFIQPWWYQLFLFATFYHTQDFLSIASSYFQTLATFCKVANLTIQESMERLLTTNFVNTQLLSKNQFDLQINTSINTFIQLTRIEFLYRMSLTKALIDSNQYLSSLKRSTHLSELFSGLSVFVFENFNPVVFPIYSEDEKGQNCYCVLDSTCTIDNCIVSGGSRRCFSWTLEGIHGGCSVMDSVLKSSIICWFKSECLHELQDLINRTNTFIAVSATPLNSTLSSRYSPDTSMETIFNELMIEEWNYSYSFHKFYQKCNPSFCLLTYEKKTDLIYMITMIISLIGGINIILRLISPFIIQIVLKLIYILKHKRRSPISIVQNINHENPSIYNRVLHLKNVLINKCSILNIFDSESDDIQTIRRERISTRIYLLVLLISVCIISIYTIFSTRITNIYISNPSEEEFNNLLMANNKTLTCPCSKIAIEYKYFIEFDPIFHDICSNDSISIRRWSQYLFGNIKLYEYHQRDIRVRGGSYFTFLMTLCTISQTIINNAIDQFLNETFISTKIMLKSDFDIQIDNIILQFQQMTLAKFARSVKLQRDIINGNAFVSSYSLNWGYRKGPTDSFNAIVTVPSYTKNGCSCGRRSDCIDSGGIHTNFDNYPQFTIPGWNVGCSVVETLLRSSLECFYDSTCVERLLMIARKTLPRHISQVDVSTINSTTTSRFETNTIVQNMADELFVEKWNAKNFYSSFYNECAPIYCSYVIEKDDYLIYTISKLLGLYGGLTIILRFTIPLIIRMIFKIRNYCRTNTITPAR
ncbi:hypothetical protein I4U23_015904 [Adineta vaga]|nr:hypothetical protein I4U23_015904 [Adineta vaga]